MGRGDPMKDIPMFTTEFGIASLILKEIPYRGEAYIRLQATEQPLELLAESIAFCRACGAEKIYATGSDALTQYPLHTEILQMQCALPMPETDAALFPVLPETLENWRSIYNERMKDVANASYMTQKDAKAMLEAGDGYFVHKDGQLLGIGKASGSKIEAVVSVIPGAGRDVVLALSSLLTDERAIVDVAGTNQRAIRLYEKLGFLTTKNLSKWYHVFPNG